MEAHATPYYGGRAPETGMAVYTQKVGMWVFLCSEVMFFTGLIGSYIILRFGASETWPQPGEILNIPVTAINTFILICSSVTMVKAFASSEMGDKRGTRLFTLATAVMGAAFLGVQIYEYNELLGHGFGPWSGLYGSTFFTMTGFHGFHVTMGTTMLLVMLIRAIKGHFTSDNHFAFEAVAWYWHFVDVVWLGLFIFVYWL